MICTIMPRKPYPRVALIYDFDGTLAPGNMQEHSFISKIDMRKGAFWREVKKIAKEHEMSEILAYMYFMLRKAQEKEVSLTNLQKHGENIRLFEGVEDYLTRIEEYARKQKLRAEHYIISSGLDEILQGTSIYRKFKKVYACAFKYDANHVPEWPAIAMDYTTKTQFLFRINKGIENRWNNTDINKYMPDHERPRPFSRMIYLGDGETDIPAMKTVRHNGGYSIAVYPKRKTRAKNKCQELIRQERAHYMAPADYQEGSELDTLIKQLIDHISSQEALKKYCPNGMCKREE